jgi:hypothetical protein
LGLLEGRRDVNERKRPKFAAVPIEVFSDPRLTLRDIRVLGVLYAFDMDRDGKCHPSRELLAEMTGMEIRRVSKVTTRLCQLGWLRKLGNGGRSRACRYEFVHVISKKTVADLTTVSGEKTVASLATGIGDKREINICPPIQNFPISSGSSSTPIGTHQPQADKTQNSGRTQPKRGHGVSVNKKLTKAEVEASFELFYTAYPRKVSKSDAIKAWGKLAPDAELTERIMVALDRQKAAWVAEKQEMKFIPYPATWLNGRRWEDEVESRAIESTSLPVGRKRGVL